MDLREPGGLVARSGARDGDGLAGPRRASKRARPPFDGVGQRRRVHAVVLWRDEHNAVDAEDGLLEVQGDLRPVPVEVAVVHRKVGYRQLHEIHAEGRDGDEGFGQSSIERFL